MESYGFGGWEIYGKKPGLMYQDKQPYPSKNWRPVNETYPNQKAKKDAYFTMRDNSRQSVRRCSVFDLKKQIDFMGSYPQMILPDNCRGNFPLLLNLLFCDDHRQNHLNPTPPRQPFCAKKLKKIFENVKLENMESVAPGAFKEVIRYFVGVQRERQIRQLEQYKFDALGTLAKEGILEVGNPVVLYLAKKLNSKTKIEISKFSRKYPIDGSNGDLAKAVVIVFNTLQAPDPIMKAIADSIHQDKKTFVSELTRLELGEQSHSPIKLSDFQYNDESIYNRLGHALFYDADPNYILQRYYDLILALEAKQLKNFADTAIERDELGIAFIAKRMKEIVEDGRIFESEKWAIWFFVRLLCLKMKLTADVSKYTIDSSLREQISDAVQSYEFLSERGELFVGRQLELQKYPHIIPEKLNYYFDPEVPRCVESTFAMYVIMLCYNFQTGGIAQRASGSKFHTLIKDLGFETIPISRWNFDELQWAMLEEVKPKACTESQLGKVGRPWFVMQNKGDMMISIAFLYNYIALFALPDLDKYKDYDPFYVDVLQSDPTAGDPLGPQGPLTIHDKMDQPRVGLEQLQKLISFVNTRAEAKYEEVVWEYKWGDAAAITKFVLTVDNMVSQSEGALTFTRAGTHFGQAVRYDLTETRYSAYEQYTEQILKSEILSVCFMGNFEEETGDIYRQFLELRLLNAHLGWNEMNTAARRYDCQEDPKKGRAHLYKYIPNSDYFKPSPKTEEEKLDDNKRIYFAQCEDRVRKLYPKQQEKDTKQQCDAAYQQTVLRQCQDTGNVIYPFNRTFSRLIYNYEIPDWDTSIPFSYYGMQIEEPEDMQPLLEQIAKDNPIACRKLLDNIPKTSYAMLEYNSLFVEGDGENFYDILQRLYGKK